MFTVMKHVSRCNSVADLCSSSISSSFRGEWKAQQFESKMRVKRKPSITTFEIKKTLWLNITIFYNSTEAQCLWLKEGIAILKFVVKFGISTKIVLNKSHPTISVPVATFRLPVQPDSASSEARRCWHPWISTLDCTNLCSLAPAMSWHAQFTSLYYRRQVTPGHRSCWLSIFDKNLYFCTSVVFRHTLLVIQSNRIGCSNQPISPLFNWGLIKEITQT